MNLAPGSKNVKSESRDKFWFALTHGSMLIGYFFMAFTAFCLINLIGSRQRTFLFARNLQPLARITLVPKTITWKIRQPHSQPDARFSIR